MNHPVKRQWKGLWLSLSFGLGIVMSTHASAFLFSSIPKEKNYVHSGLGCQALYPEQQDHLRYTSNRVTNSHTSSVRVLCPITKTLGDETVRVNATVHGYKPAQSTGYHDEFRCWLYARARVNVFGYDYHYTNVKYAYERDRGYFGMSLALRDGPKRSSYSLLCAVPSGGYLRNYIVDEFED